MSAMEYPVVDRPRYVWWVRFSVARALCLLLWVVASVTRSVILIVETALHGIDWRLAIVDRFCCPGAMPPPLWMMVAIKVAAPLGRAEALRRWYWSHAREVPRG